MSDRQLRLAGLFPAACLVLAVIVGIAWRAATPAPGAETPHTEAGREDPRRTAPGTVVRHIEVPPGWRAEQIADALDRASIADGGRFLEAVRRRRLEGRLYPGVYDVGPGFSEDVLIADMTARFAENFTPTMRRRARATGVTVSEVITLASIVQQEIVYASEAPVVAAVYLNRLRAGMRLKADPTVVYALDSARADQVFWNRRLSYADLRVDSPYNTYRRRGLPPAPIASPTREALHAVLYPASVDYRFFVATGDGTHVFARTGRQHVEFVEQIRAKEQRPAPGSALQVMVERLMAHLPAHVGVVVKNLRSGETAVLSGDEFFTSASLYKLAVMLTAFQQREERGLSFGERLTIAPSAAAEDSPAILARLGTRPTIRKAIQEMIVVSSNAAGVTLLHRFGRGAIDRTLRRYGLRDTSLSSLRIVTTPNDIARMLELLAEGTAVSPGASRKMVAIMLRQEIDDRLPKYLPRHARLAHKTGTLDFPSHDAGILYTRSGPVVIVALTEDAKKRAVATEAVARLGRLVYDYFESYSPTATLLASARNSACPKSPFQPKRGGVLVGRRIVLDPGHGGLSHGHTATFPNGSQLHEKDVVLSIARHLQRMLVARGATVYMTRCRDVFRSQMARSALANAAGPHLVVSLHLGGSARRVEDGTEVAYYLRDGSLLAKYILGSFSQPALWETLSASRPLPNNGLERRPSVQLVHTLAPIVQTEAVFITNPVEAAALRATDGRRRRDIARGHLLGILRYFGVKPTSHPPLRNRAKRTQPRSRAGVVRIAATGDVAMGTSPTLPADGGAGLFGHVRELLSGDVVLGNLETALATGGTSKCVGRTSSRCYAFRGPPSYAQWLRRAGFTVLNLANNHSQDFGSDGAAETIEALDGAGLAHTGRPGQIARLTRRGVRIGVIGVAPYPWAQDLLDISATQRLVERADRWADVVIVTMHAGGEGANETHVRPGPEVYFGEPRGDPVRFARAMVDAGADLVVGHGPHVLRGMEWYRGRLIAYSLGNFSGFHNFALDGPLSVSGVLQVTLASDGTWRRGRLSGLRLGGAGTPRPDDAALPVVAQLSRDDFGASAVHLSANGELAPPSGSVSRAEAPVRPRTRPEFERATLDQLLQLGSAVYCGGGSDRYVALTFDDGPSAHTRDLIQLLRSAGARATFFPLGERISRWDSVLRTQAEVGKMGDHTWSHPDLTRLDHVSAAVEIVWAQRLLESAVGRRVRLFRPPYGAHNRAIDGVVRANGMVQVLWDVDSGDSRRGATTASIVANVLLGLRPGSIVLFHDTSRTTIDGVRALLPILRRKGFRTVTVPELLTLDPPSLAQGRNGDRGRRCLGSPLGDMPTLLGLGTIAP